MLLRWFVRKYQVDLSESQGDIDDFDSLSSFFIRHLKPGMRPIDAAPDMLVSPVDGKAHTFGRIENGSFLQADGRPASVAELVGESESARYEGGGYAVLYLAPPDYHRVHSPVDGHIVSLDYRPGKLWPVFAAATRKVDELFGRNEAIGLHIWIPSREKWPMSWWVRSVLGESVMCLMSKSPTQESLDGRVIEPAPAVERGGEMGRFELGSTVILLTEPGRIEWTMEQGQVLRMGRPIARIRGVQDAL